MAVSKGNNSYKNMKKTHSGKCANVLLGLKEKYECLGQQPEISQVGLIFLNLLSDIIFLGKSLKIILISKWYKASNSNS